MLPINRNPAEREIRTFTRIWFPLFVAMFGGVLWWRGASPLAVGLVWGVGAVLVALALASREAARIIFVGLMTVTYPIGLVVSTLALGVMFYLVFTPLGFVMRLGGRDPLRLGARKDASHWLPHEQDDSPERAFRQY
jgi:saxitoxin biosynthesis operon SxtJ-like protein